MKTVATAVPAEVLAAQQDGLFSVRQGIRSGLTSGQIAWRRASGRYRRCRRGVVQVAGVPPSWRQTVRMASLAAGEPAVVSHASAVRLFCLQLPPSVHQRWGRDDAFIELAAPIPRHVRLHGVRGHRSGTWEDNDVVRYSGMAVTSPLRTVIDLSSRLGVDGTGRLFDEMLRRKLVTVEALRERLAGLRAAPGRSLRVLRAVLAHRDGIDASGESTPEERTSSCRPPEGTSGAADGQQWRRNATFSIRLDFASPGVRVDIEGDGFRLHCTASDLDRTAGTPGGPSQRTCLQLTWGINATDVEHHASSLSGHGGETSRRPP